MSPKSPAADRAHGGPGSSRQDATDSVEPGHHHGNKPAPGQPTNPPRSRVSGGGGERDIHHTHDPATKS
jgi:hypothetical protein